MASLYVVDLLITSSSLSSVLYFVSMNLVSVVRTGSPSRLNITLYVTTQKMTSMRKIV